MGKAQYTIKGDLTFRQRGSLTSDIMTTSTTQKPDQSTLATFWSHWSVVGASWIGLFFHFGSLLINTFGIFLTSLCAEFGWTRAEVSLAFTLAMVTAMISMPVAGWVTDRHGSRWLIIGATTLYGLALAALAGQSGAYWQLVAIFLLLGLLGPGTSAIPHATLLARRRSARAGLALGVAMSGTAVGGIVWPAAAQYLLDRFGLRTGYLLLGAGILLIAVPVMLLLLREEPGRQSAPPPGSEASSAGLTRLEALRSPAFLILGISFIIFMASVQAIMIHLVPMLTDRGMLASRAAWIASLLGLAGIFGRIVCGYLLDLLPPTTVPVIAFLLVAVGIILLATGASGALAMVAVLLIGFGYGADAASIPCLIRHYFGTRAFGQIYSYLFVAVPIGGAIGPMLMGIGFVRWGSYRLVLIGWGVLTLLAAGLMLRLATLGRDAVDRSKGVGTDGLD